MIAINKERVVITVPKDWLVVIRSEAKKRGLTVSQYLARLGVGKELYKTYE